MERRLPLEADVGSRHTVYGEYSVCESVWWVGQSYSDTQTENIQSLVDAEQNGKSISLFITHAEENNIMTISQQ